MQKLTQLEFISLLKHLLVDALFPDHVHIPGIGIRMTYASFLKFSEDLYKAYFESGESGFVIFMEKLKKRPDINLAVEKTKKLIFSHLDTLGLKNETERQNYVSSIESSIKSKINP